MVIANIRMPKVVTDEHSCSGLERKTFLIHCSFKTLKLLVHTVFSALQDLQATLLYTPCPGSQVDKGSRS